MSLFYMKIIKIIYLRLPRYKKEYLIFSYYNFKKITSILGKDFILDSLSNKNFIFIIHMRILLF